MTLIEQLNRLAEIAPEVCQKAKFGRYAIGEYHFGERNNKFFAVRGSNFTYGRPALAWLEAALRQVIEARGWSWELYRIQQVKYIATVGPVRRSADSPAGALLAALIAALGER